MNKVINRRDKGMGDILNKSINKHLLQVTILNPQITQTEKVLEVPTLYHFSCLGLLSHIFSLEFTYFKHIIIWLHIFFNLTSIYFYRDYINNSLHSVQKYARI